MEASDLKAIKRTSARSTTSDEPKRSGKSPVKTTRKGEPAGTRLSAHKPKSSRREASKPAPSGHVTTPASAIAPIQEAGHLGDVYDPECPSQKALETIATKWAILVLHTLIAEPMRFNKLQLTLSGISQKVLTQQLRKLEKAGLIHRRVRPTSPPSVVYEITPAGLDLRTALSGLCDWANKHAVALGIAQKSMASSLC